MILRGHAVPVAKQCKLLAIARSTAYYKPMPVPAATLDLMRRIDKLHLDYPFMGSRMLAGMLKLDGIAIGRRQVRTLMRRMAIEAHYCRPNTSRKHPNNPVYPYLLRELTIERANQVWATDITYIPMKHGFCYLVAVVDWFTRRVLSWRLSNTMHSDFCVEALEEALERFGTPEIFNTDQGSQFTGADFTGVLKAKGIRISMDGKGRWVDNVIVERFWRSLKYEEVYQKGYENLRDARLQIGIYIDFFNFKRTHDANDGLPPALAYDLSLATRGAA